MSSGRILAAARTPWAPRHTALDGCRPEDLLGAAAVAAVERAGLTPDDVDRVLVACDTTVGAQDLDIARRAVLALGWDAVPGLTADAQGVGGLALVHLAVSLPGITLVAGVDASSLVPPGAGLVRDYGRPTLDEPEHRWLDRVAQAAGLDRAGLDAVVAELLVDPPLTAPAIIPEGVAGVAEDTCRAPVDTEAPPLVEGGVVTGDHLAPWADGAVAVVVADGGADGREIVSSTWGAGSDQDALDWITGAIPSVVAVDHTAVVTALSGGWAHPVVSPLAVGSAPSCDGLRVLADVVTLVDDAVEIRTRGRHGQTAAVGLAST